MATILVVEDEPHIARAVRDRLHHAGHVVTSAPSGPRALAAVAGQRPDLIILDVLMPDMDGFEVIRRLKGDPATRDIPVMLLTVLVDDERLRTAGADAYLAKPYRNADLIRVVGEVLARPAAATGGGRRQAGEPAVAGPGHGATDGATASRSPDAEPATGPGPAPAPTPTGPGDATNHDRDGGSEPQRRSP